MSCGRIHVLWEDSCLVGGLMSCGRTHVLWEDSCLVGGLMSCGRIHVLVLPQDMSPPTRHDSAHKT
jgi:hypothetical protein